MAIKKARSLKTRRNRVSGVDETLKELNKKIGKIVGATRAGAFAGALIIQAEAMRRVPIHFGNLRGSAYTKKTERGAVVGFSAKYALYVHENLEMTLAGQPRPDDVGVYWGPDGEAQFLFKAAIAKQKAVLDAVKAHAEKGLNANS